MNHRTKRRSEASPSAENVALYLFCATSKHFQRDGARVVAEHIREAANAVRIAERNRQIPVGVSIGIGEWAPGRTLDDVMAEVRAIPVKQNAFADDNLTGIDLDIHLRNTLQL